MRIAGLSPEAPGEHSDLVGRHADGTLSGLFFETACELIDRAIPALSAEARRAAVLRAAAIYHSFGVTGFVQAATSEVTLDAFKRLDQKGELQLWIAACIATNALLTPAHEGIGQAVIDRRDAYRSAHIAVDFVKFFMDGVPGARTAAFDKPYVESGGLPKRAPPLHSAVELGDLIRPLDVQGIQAKVHAVGDKAIRLTLDAIEAVRHANGQSGPQHSIAHLSYVAEEDIPRLARLNVAADFCPPLWFPNPILHVNDRVLGDGRGAKAWPTGDIVHSGALSMLGTDWPIIPSPNPWPGLAGLVTRTDPKRETPGVFRPEQRLRLSEALPLCTINVARHMGFGEKIGSISVGKAADFIVLDRDLFEVEPEAIADTTVLRTYFAGRLVHQA
jgi:predicted amidohydrolase YtcJ